MSASNDRHRLPVLGVVAHNYLRETGLLRMREDVRIAFFGASDSALHRIADYSCPLPGLDIDHEILERAVANAAARQIELNGLISLRDPNVPSVAAIAKRNWPDHTPSLESIGKVASKFRFRSWLNDESNIAEDIFVRIRCEPLPQDIDERSFTTTITEMLQHGSVIMKPECGSCSYHIIHVRKLADVSLAWRQLKFASHYRNGDFIAEQEVQGDEMAVETVVDDRVRYIGITPYLPPDARMFYEVGHYVPDQLSEDIRDRIRELATAVHDAMPLRHIVTHMEIKIQRDGKPAVIELNPRLAGDLTQELHRLVTGIDYYRIAAHVATGRPIPATLLEPACRHRCALIKFHRPVSGLLRQIRDPAEYFKSPDDRFGLCHPRGSLLTGGNTNDDRSAYILLTGEGRSELEARANEALDNCLIVDRAPFFAVPT